MTVFELIQELAQYDPDEEVYFNVEDVNYCDSGEIEGTTEHVRKYCNGRRTYLYIQCRQEMI